MTLALGAAFGIAAISPLLARILGRDAGWPLAVLLAALAGYIWVAIPVDTVSTIAWMPALGIDLRLALDPLARVFTMLVLGIGAVVMAYSSRYLGRGGGHGGYYGLMTLFAASMLGLVLADDVVLLFVAWEFTTLCSFFLITLAGPKGTQPAVRTLLVTVAGGLCLLTAAALMVVRTGTTVLSDILSDPVWTQDPAFAAVIAVLIAMAAFTKSAQFPFQAWLPDAMVAATPVSAYLHAAAMVKAGIYLLLRFSEALHDVPVWNLLLIACGMTTAVLGAVFAMQRDDLKELLAYSTISQLGFLVATIGVGTPEAMVAAIVHTIAHALFKSSLFMFVGVVDHQTGTRAMSGLPPLYRIMPGTAGGVALAAASMAGLPPLLGFVSKEWMFKSMLEAPGAAWTGPALGALAVFAATFTFAYSARFLLGGFVTHGPPARPGPEPVHDTPESIAPPRASFFIPAALPAALGLFLGFTGFLLEPVVAAAARASIGAGYEADFGLWHGFAPELFMSMTVIAVGIVLVIVRHPVERFLDRELAPITGVATVDALRRWAIAGGARVGDVTRTDRISRHVWAVLIVLFALAAVGVATVRPAPEVGSPVRVEDWVVVVLLGVGTAAMVVSRSRLGAVANVGIVGFAMALWFFTLGAVDVALTQLLVEVLTVVVIVLVLQRLPRAFHPVSRSRMAVSAAAAVVVGLASGAAVWAMTGRRELSDVGRYFLDNAEEDTGGINVVNTVLVDYRALDTLGELTVLGVAGLAVILALHARRALPRREVPLTVPGNSPLLPAGDNGVFLRTFARILGPLIVLLSLYFLVRGHNAPGGGFNSALIGGAGIAVYYLRARDDASARIRVPYVAVIAAGVIIGVVTGLVGFVDGSFLLPLHAYLGGVHLTTALVFDVGVYLAVLGVIMAAVDKLGGDDRSDEPTGPRGPSGPPAPAGPGAEATTEAATEDAEPTIDVADDPPDDPADHPADHPEVQA
nr:DUF4040 family protein [Dietzia sp. DQ11-71]